jgi:hypothetical protein
MSTRGSLAMGTRYSECAKAVLWVWWNVVGPRKIPTVVHLAANIILESPARFCDYAVRPPNTVFSMTDYGSRFLVSGQEQEAFILIPDFPSE